MMKILTWVLIFGLGFYAGYYRSTLVPAETLSNIKEKVTDVKETFDGTKIDEGEEASATTTASTTSSGAAVSAPVTIETSTLTDSQKALLKTLGIDAQKVTVTPKMMACAYDTLGEARVSEIVAGSSPGPLEIALVLPCLK